MAEDQIHNMQVLKQQLSNLGKEDLCEFVYNGKEAVECASRLIQAGENISYILTDFMMPRMNGIQAVEQIQSYIKYWNALPDKHTEFPIVVFLTAYKTAAFDRLLHGLDVHLVFEKPLTQDQLQFIFEEE